jgi:hypothetical protein
MLSIALVETVIPVLQKIYSNKVQKIIFTFHNVYE